MICKYYEKCGVVCCGDSGEVDIENCQTADIIHSLEYTAETFRTCHYNEQRKRKRYEEILKEIKVLINNFGISDSMEEETYSKITNLINEVIK